MFRKGGLVTNRSKTTRLIAKGLLAAQLMAGLPVFAAPQTVGEQPPLSSVDAPSSEATADKPQRPPNRTVPAVTPPSTVSTLADTPTNADLSAAHLFSEPLIPMPGPTSRAENRALAIALRAYAAGHRSEMVAPLLQFLSQYPRSAWRPSLLANIGTTYRTTGYLSRA